MDSGNDTRGLFVRVIWNGHALDFEQSSGKHSPTGWLRLLSSHRDFFSVGSKWRAIVGFWEYRGNRGGTEGQISFLGGVTLPLLSWLECVGCSSLQETARLPRKLAEGENFAFRAGRTR